jgi:murein DD-endopeptidase MepM/ murein hydrolase activator NlpD
MILVRLKGEKAWPVALLVIMVTTNTGLGTGSSLITTIQWFPETPRQGDVIHFVAKTGERGITVHARFLDRNLPFFMMPSDSEEYHAICGVDYSQDPGTYELVIGARKNQGREEQVKFRITVKAKEFPEEYLTLPEEMVILSPENQRRAQDEQNRITRIFSTMSPERLWRGAFVMPLNGKLGSPFGMRRIINRLPRSPHSGQDVKAPEGAPVVASNRGKVALVGDFFFGGESVFIDHGEGMYSMYFHLSVIRVREGEIIQKGDVLGLVGKTGRALGPHLHWGVRIRGARVDPLVLVKATGSLVE